jgi:hypothetical protein
MHISQMPELTPLHQRPKPLHCKCQALNLGIKLVHLIISFHPAIGMRYTYPLLILLPDLLLGSLLITRLLSRLDELGLVLFCQYLLLLKFTDFGSCVNSSLFRQLYYVVRERGHT